MRVKLEETPQDLRRRVANKLESIRGTPMATGGDAARLGEEACPIYRPDIDGVAYWEFEVVGLKETQAREHDGRSSGVGFMLASAGRHDVPIPHWSLTAEPPSRALESKAREGKVARVVKLDTLAYAAEDEKGNYLTHLGQFPPMIVGAASDLKKLQGISTVTAAPKKPTNDDAEPGKLALKRSGVPVPKLKVVAWESWEQAREGYAKVYKPHLDALAAHAAEAWEIEDLIAKFGEGIHEGGKLTVPLLKSGRAAVPAESAKVVRMTQSKRQPPAVILEALSSDAKGEVSFQLDISYADGTRETLPFFVVPKDTPSNNRNVSPYLMASLEGGN